MKVTKHEWWVTPVWQVDLELPTSFNLALLQEVEEYYKNSNTKHQDSNIWECHTPAIDRMNTLILDVVKEHTYDYIAPNYSDDNFRYIHSRGWLNYHRTSQDLPLHGHGGSKISATYYINAPDNCGDLMLVDPRGGVDWEKGWDLGINGTKYNRLTPKTGTLVFFPSYVLHWVDRNRNSDPRISMTTDISTLSPRSIEYFANLAKEQ